MLQTSPKNAKTSANAYPVQGFQRNTERPCAAPKTGRDANKDICLGSASRGKTLKQFSPQPVEKIKLQLQQHKGRISSLIFPWLQSMGKNFQEVQKGFYCFTRFCRVSQQYYFWQMEGDRSNKNTSLANAKQGLHK